MREVRLYTKTCEDSDYVATVIIPPFQPMPDVLLWGERFFIRVTDDQYREAFAVAALIKKEGV